MGDNAWRKELKTWNFQSETTHQYQESLTFQNNKKYLRLDLNIEYYKTFV